VSVTSSAVSADPVTTIGEPLTYPEKTCRMVRNMQVMREKAGEDRMAGSEEGIVFTSNLGTF
jgi:hypothetical protein